VFECFYRSNLELMVCGNRKTGLEFASFIDKSKGARVKDSRRRCETEGVTLLQIETNC